MSPFYKSAEADHLRGAQNAKPIKGQWRGVVYVIGAAAILIELLKLARVL